MGDDQHQQGQPDRKQQPDARLLYIHQRRQNQGEARVGTRPCDATREVRGDLDGEPDGEHGGDGKRGLAIGREERARDKSRIERDRQQQTGRAGPPGQRSTPARQPPGRAAGRWRTAARR